MFDFTVPFLSVLLTCSAKIGYTKPYQSEKEERNMAWKQWLVGAAVGAAVVYAIRSASKPALLAPEQALALAKAALGGPRAIRGSWIQSAPERYEKNGLAYTVYRGGVCCDDGDDEFFVNACTGAIIEIRPL
ncbi:peptidase M4 [Geobacillus thermopakistaniensis]|uniref:Peptidase M4 n=2 Tax=Geobacillus thermopakistaniensis (strain MAS1) TaxID=1408282 RepID=A0A7U9JDT6_GEOTM|nr:peptidase M4 [Geobacillus sp. MAS1]